MLPPTLTTTVLETAVPLVTIPPRGKIVSIIQDQPIRESLEAALVRAGFLLFRARDVWHASVLAGSTLPNLILAEVSAWSSLGSELFDSLRRNRETSEIPVLALVDSAIQARPGASTYQKSTAAMMKSSGIDSIIGKIDELIAAKAAPAKHRIDPAIENIDAVFSEFGRRKANLNPKKVVAPSTYRDPGKVAESTFPFEAQLPHTTLQPKRMKFSVDPNPR